jgi:hypothetical protein
MENGISAELKILRLCEIIIAKVDKLMKMAAADQKILDDYKAKNPTKTLIINTRQSALNDRADSLETIEEAVNYFPDLLEQERARCKQLGREEQKRQTIFYKTDAEKEAARHYSIAEAQLKYNF